MAKVRRVTLEETQTVNQAQALADHKSAFAKRFGSMPGRQIIDIDRRARRLDANKDIGQ